MARVKLFEVRREHAYALRANLDHMVGGRLCVSDSVCETSLHFADGRFMSFDTTALKWIDLGDGSERFWWPLKRKGGEGLVEDENAWENPTLYEMLNVLIQNDLLPRRTHRTVGERCAECAEAEWSECDDRWVEEVLHEGWVRTQDGANLTCP